MSEDKYEKFEKRMHEEYPHMFSRPYGGFAVGEGWWTIIDILCHHIHAHVSWKRHRRAQDLMMQRAIKRGYFAVLRRVAKGKEPTEWDIEHARELMALVHRPPTEKVERVVVAQIKEKFGGLRFYYDGGDDYVAGLVSMAESWAGKTCEECGSLGHSRSGGWIRTLCDQHEAERQERMKRID